MFVNCLLFIEPNTLCVDYNSIHCTHIVATQELDRIQQRQLLDISGNKVDIEFNNNELELLKQENQELKTEVVSLKSQLANINRRLDILENA